MGTLTSIIITSLFLAIIFVKNGWSRPIKVLFKIKLSKFIKPFDCLPCMSFWFSILVCTAWNFFIWPIGWLMIAVSTMGAFVVAYITDNK